MAASSSKSRLTVEATFHIRRWRHGARQELRPGPKPARVVVGVGRIPRVARLLALALRFEELIRGGQVASYAELAKLGHVSRARVSQIMNLLLLAPNLQEEILFLPATQRGRDALRLWQLQPIALELDWKRQRRLWRRLRAGGRVRRADGPPRLAHVGGKPPG